VTAGATLRARARASTVPRKSRSRPGPGRCNLNHDHPHRPAQSGSGGRPSRRARAREPGAPADRRRPPAAGSQACHSAGPRLSLSPGWQSGDPGGNPSARYYLRRDMLESSVTSPTGSRHGRPGDSSHSGPGPGTELAAMATVTRDRLARRRPLRPAVILTSAATRQHPRNRRRPRFAQSKRNGSPAVLRPGRAVPRPLTS
jgi:hypothetical protein